MVMDPPKQGLSDLPNWPRLMGAELAARYVGVSESAFRRGAGSAWPEPVRVGRRCLWDRLALDAAIDRLARQKGNSTDPYMEAVDGLDQSALH